MQYSHNRVSTDKIMKHVLVSGNIKQVRQNLAITKLKNCSTKVGGDPTERKLYKTHYTVLKNKSIMWVLLTYRFKSHMNMKNKLWVP